MPSHTLASNMSLYQMKVKNKYAQLNAPKEERRVKNMFLKLQYNQLCCILTGRTVRIFLAVSFLKSANTAGVPAARRTTGDRSRGRDTPLKLVLPMQAVDVGVNAGAARRAMVA